MITLRLCISFNIWTDDDFFLLGGMLLLLVEYANVVDGTITPTVSYLMPDTLTVGTTSFDVTPAPTFSIANDFTSTDDS
mgnify:CR=1 FL=1